MFLSFWHAGIDFATRKIASVLKPQKVIKQNGDCFTIRTLTTFRSYECSFRIGEEFKEVTKGMDNRSCQVKTLSKCRLISESQCCMQMFLWSLLRNIRKIKAVLEVILQTVFLAAFSFSIRLWSTGKMISWCVFRKERRRTEGGLTGFRETSFIWYMTALFYSGGCVCD